VFDHVTIRVSDRGASEGFYDTVLTPLGIETSYRTNVFTVWREFTLTESDGEHPVTRAVDVAFVAPSREQVEDFWESGRGGGRASGPDPAERDGDYVAWLEDPDGNRVQAVHHGGTRPGAAHRDGRIHELVIRVSDLAAATAFYRTIADAAGYEIVSEGADRAVFAATSGGGTFALVPGEPVTENLHIAFPGDDDAVRRFHELATAAGHRSNGEPAERAQYHAGYYAAYVLDPDGTNVEVVSRNLG
jgi:catechol 2,3-dioxygenase-like lactoylglutathione lyase family enzyme